MNQNIFHISDLSILGLQSTQGTVILLSTEETICIGGAYIFTVLQGTISLLGTTLGASTKLHRIYAPKSSPLPIIEASSSEPSILKDDQLHGLGLVNAPGAIVLIQELRTGVQGLGRVCKTFDSVFDFSRYTRRDEDNKLLNVTGAFMLRSQEKDYEPYVLSKSWAYALDNMAPPSSGGVYLVKGPKKSGKSTFARTLLNRLLLRFERVAYLDCDLGQSEFTPGGMVALNVIQDPCFGPPFTHPTLPNRAHYIGTTTPRSPGHYLASIQALFQAYELDVRNPLLAYDNHGSNIDGELPTRISDVIPLVVNTMGWNKGLGADLNKKIQDIVQPTHVFEVMSSTSTIDNLNYEENADHRFESKPEFYAQLDPVIASNNSPLYTQYTPADHRIINILSYLHASFPGSSDLSDPTITSLEQITATSWRTALPLCSQLPYAVAWGIALDRIVLVGNASEDVVPAEVGRVLNGALVGLVSSWGDDRTSNIPVRSETESRGVDLSPQLPYEQGAQPPEPTSSTCYGIALIRSVSHCSPPAVPENVVRVEPEMHVLTPVPPSLLKHSRIFVKGEMDLPVWGMLDYAAGDDDDGWKNGVAGMDWGRVPYLQWGKGEGVGSERRRIRRNLMRKAQM
ncbi:hypothetical protein APHAL10511_001480 [Amanita phalloides]|nr:hypothetical protein APHAL10511_001480 [Amanita phalloides]